MFSKKETRASSSLLDFVDCSFSFSCFRSILFALRSSRRNPLFSEREIRSLRDRESTSFIVILVTRFASTCASYTRRDSLFGLVSCFVIKKKKHTRTHRRKIIKKEGRRTVEPPNIEDKTARSLVDYREGSGLSLRPVEIVAVTEEFDRLIE